MVSVLWDLVNYSRNASRIVFYGHTEEEEQAEHRSCLGLEGSGLALFLFSDLEIVVYI